MSDMQRACDACLRAGDLRAAEWFWPEGERHALVARCGHHAIAAAAQAAEGACP